ncbi:hypothetical protein C6Q17_14240 [Burkholderia contaminans]|nr:hypothetical protein C6Q17_14240 [Burkholderia contaminans]
MTPQLSKLYRAVDRGLADTTGIDRRRARRQFWRAHAYMRRVLTAGRRNEYDMDRVEWVRRRAVEHLLIVDAHIPCEWLAQWTEKA